MSLALATLIYEWRRYLAAVVALAFSGLMVLGTTGIFTGIVHSVLATTERSRADLFILPAKSPRLINSDSGLPTRVKPVIYLNPEVTGVEALGGGGGSWVNVPRGNEKQVQAYVQTWAIDTEPGSLTIPIDYTPDIVQALSEPGAVVADVSDLPRLGVKIGDQAALNGKTVTLRGVLRNYPGVTQPTVIMSHDTARRLGMEGDDNGRTGPLMVSIRNPKDAERVANQLNASANGLYIALTRAQLNANDEKALLSEQIIGVLLVFFVFLAIGIGIGITSQTLRGAILSNVREFASLRALGISMIALRIIVMELSFWVGVAGLGATLLLTFTVALITNGIGLPMVIRAGTFEWVGIMLMILAVASGAMAMGILKKSQPADLLR